MHHLASALTAAERYITEHNELRHATGGGTGFGAVPACRTIGPGLRLPVGVFGHDVFPLLAAVARGQL
jgi:hypothetical protein